jgi:hypothetical protein
MIKLRNILNESSKYTKDDLVHLKPHLDLANKYKQLRVSKIDFANPNLNTVIFYMKLQDHIYSPDTVEYTYLLESKKWVVMVKKTTPLGNNGGSFKTTTDDKWVLNHMKTYIKRAIAAGVND